MKVDNERKQEFIKKLSIETPLSPDDSEYLVKYIDSNGNLDTAEQIYEKEGLGSLIGYKQLLVAAGF